jgi:hypothetical protein
MLVRFLAHDLASLNNQTGSPDSFATPAVATRDAAGLKISEAGERVELSALTRVQIVGGKTWSIPQHINKQYLTGLPTLVTSVGSSSNIRDLAGDQPVSTRLKFAEAYDKLASVLASVRRMAVERGPESAMSIVMEGAELKVYDRTTGPLHPASIRARFEKT